MIMLKQIEELETSIFGLKEKLNLNDLKQKELSLKLELEKKEVWENSQKATKINQELKTVQTKIQKFRTLSDSLENLKIAFELKEEIETEKFWEEATKLKIELENETYLNGKFDYYNCLLSVYAGAGGTDAQDFAAMLLSMYQAFCQKMNWNCKIISLSSSEEGGIKSATLEVFGSNAYGLLKEEFGVHRLVRISPFNSGGTRETSFALVEVLPSGLEQEIDLKIEERDLRWDFFMASGKGGQSVNTTYSAVRLTHIPTKIAVSCQNERSQQQNKQQALKYLKNKLAILELQKQKDLIGAIKGQIISPEWGSQIRSYVLHPYKLVKDHRSNFQTTEILEVLEKGEILDFIFSIKKLG
jgi:peptide chain release factor 2